MIVCVYTGGITLTAQEDYSSGHVGNPFTCNEVKLVSVPYMNYLCTDSRHSTGESCLGRGEVYVRGPNVFQGYYKDPKETSAILQYPSSGDGSTLPRDPWLRTGDIGLFTVNNQLRLIDRRKNMLKLAQGEYIAVEKLEQKYSGACGTCVDSGCSSRHRGILPASLMHPLSPICGLCSPICQL